MILIVMLYVILVQAFLLCLEIFMICLVYHRLKNCYFNVPLADVAKKKPLGRITDVLTMVNNNLVPIDFLVLDVECNSSCPIILGRPFLRTVGAIIDMKEGAIKYQFPLKKGMEHFPRKRKKLLFDSIIRENYELDASSLEIT
jgi:hypothetical protein